MGRRATAQATHTMPAQAEIRPGQDWNTVTFDKKPMPARAAVAVKDAQRAGQPVLTERRHNQMVTDKGMNARKLDEESENLKHNKVSADLRLAIMRARTAKGLTQKQLAALLNIQPVVINEYESGKAIPNNAVIARIERAVGAKLPRAQRQ